MLSFEKGIRHEWRCQTIKCKNLEFREHLSFRYKHGICWSIVGIESCETVQHAGPEELVQIKKRSPENKPYGTLVLSGQDIRKNQQRRLKGDS